jgi:hypothetical protein
MTLAVLLPSLALAQSQSTPRMRGDFPPPPHWSGSLQTAQAESLPVQSDAAPSPEKREAPTLPDMMNTWEYSEQEWK